MSIDRAEELKRTWTDKHVTVLEGIPELRRFQGLVGRVRTVNMNCRLLVEFQAAADISWYDIDPTFVSIVDTPASDTESAADALKTKSATPDTPSAPDTDKSPPTPVTGSGSPLDQIRQQATQSASTESTKTQSPLDQIRAQSAGNAATTASAPASDNSQSPLDTIRAQATSGSAPPAAENPATTPSISPLEAIRLQNANQGPEAAPDNAPTLTAAAEPKEPLSAEPQADDIPTPPEVLPATGTIPSFLTGAAEQKQTFEIHESGAFIRQIRRQAGMSEESNVPDFFQQIRAQAQSRSSDNKS